MQSMFSHSCTSITRVNAKRASSANSASSTRLPRVAVVAAVRPKILHCLLTPEQQPPSNKTVGVRQRQKVNAAVSLRA